MSRRNGQDHAISWVNQQSDNSTKALIDALNEDCRSNLDGIPVEMRQAIHQRALQNVFAIVRAGAGATLSTDSSSSERKGDFYSLSVSTGDAPNTSKPGTRRKRRTKAATPPKEVNESSPDLLDKQNDSTVANVSSFTQ